MFGNENSRCCVRDRAEDFLRLLRVIECHGKSSRLRGFVEAGPITRVGFPVLFWRRTKCLGQNIVILNSPLANAGFQIVVPMLSEEFICSFADGFIDLRFDRCRSLWLVFACYSLEDRRHSTAIKPLFLAFPILFWLGEKTILHNGAS
mmetsp:Transcript_14735/g.33862  ORF Transcript_14735/g.33862 Transcript_14735/m.33862 type:complete len:148 (+) Transcript_14735:438-881(+)